MPDVTVTMERVGEGAEIKVVHYSTPTDLIKRTKRNINNDRSPTMECIIGDARCTYPNQDTITVKSSQFMLCGF